MNKTLLIVTEDSPKGEECSRILAGFQYEIRFASPDEVLSPTVVDEIFLVLLTEYNQHSLIQLVHQRIPDFIPALVLYPTLPSPTWQGTESQGRLVDYYIGEIDPRILKVKIDFLRRVAKLGFEHTNYLENHTRILDSLTTRDGLTGLYNRHHLNKTLHSQYLLARDSGSDLSLLVLDIDCFNEINTAFGQSFGDFVLNEMSARLTDSTRKEDLCFRRSGGDFVVLMPEVDLDGAKNTAEKIRQSCIGKPFCRKEMKREVTLSIGVASRKTHHPASADEFINMAETALFKAKADGRNRVYIYGPRGAAPSEIRQLDFESIKVRINRILEKTRHSAVSSIQLLARDVAGPGHREHIERVTNYTDLLGRQLGLPPAIIQTLQNAIILYTSIRHLIHNDLLSQRYRFSESDWKTLQDFPYKLSEIVEIFDYFAHERLILLTRSENYDGSGYPEGLKGAEIPLGARIISIVDSFAAMKADRPHRRRLEPDAILHELKTEAGKQFDPFLVLKLLDIIQRDNLLEVSDVDIAEFRAELLKKQSGSGL